MERLPKPPTIATRFPHALFFNASGFDVLSVGSLLYELIESSRPSYINVYQMEILKDFI